MKVLIPSKPKMIWISIILFAGLLLGFGIARGLSLAAPTVETSTPHIVSYQGRVLIDGSPYNGTGYFKFAITNESVTAIYWGNDGIAPPSASIPLYVDNGFFNINLGDETLPNMVALSPVVFSGVDRYLQVWFSSNDVDFAQLPVTRITSVPYALVADTLDGLDSTEYALFTHDHDTRYYTKSQVDALLSQGYDNVIIVAKSGGDYTTLGEALSNIKDAAADNLYLVWIAPGIYEEKPLQLLPYVHIQGAAQEATQLLSATSDTTDPPDEGSLMLAPNSSLRDLTLINLGDGLYNTAILANGGVTNTYLTNLSVSAEGSGSTNFAIYLDGSGVKVDLDNLQVTARNGTTRNCALIMRSHPQAIVHGGSYLAEGDQSYAFTLSYGAVLTATHTTGMAVGSPSFGLNVRDESRVVLEGGSFTSKGYSSSPVYGINTSESDTSLIAEDVRVVAEGFGTGLVHGLRNRNGSKAQLTGGVYHAYGGTTTYGILNESGISELTANEVQVSASGEGYVYGLNNSGTGKLVGGSYYAEGGNYVFGVFNDGLGSRLDANDVSAHGKLSMVNAFGLYIDSGIATLTGGEYVGETGSDLTCGIYNQSQLFATGTSASGFFGLGTTYGLRNDSTARLTDGTYLADNGYGGVDAFGISNQVELYASEVTAIGRYSGERNYGLYNLFLASTEILGGSFSGMDGEEAIGITNAHSSTLTASGFSAMGRDASNRNIGLLNSDDGIATISDATLTGHGGDYAIGVENLYLNSFLQATNIIATGEQANNNAYGLSNAYAAETLIDNSTFTAQSTGNDAFGIFNFRSTLAGTHITARGLDAAGGSGEGLHNGDKGNPTLVDISHCVLEGDDYSYNTDTPSVFLNHCRFKGSTQGTGGTTLCMASTQDSTWYENTCP